MPDDREELLLMDFVEAAAEAARLGGRILQDWSQKFTAWEKGPSDLVTEADQSSQEAIFQFLRDQFPDHNFLGEEGLNHSSGDSPYCWIIDPLDGTANYVHRFPYYSVSIGLEKNGELIAGAIYDPTRDEMFLAGLGAGATRNGEPISPSSVETVSNALCLASLPSKVDRDHPAVKKFVAMLEVAQVVQRTGSAALNLCAIACGRADVFWAERLNPWDMAAGVLIVQEAGGRVTKSDGTRFQVRQPTLLATNGILKRDELIEKLQTAG